MAGHPSPGSFQNEGSQVFTIPYGQASVEALASQQRPAAKGTFAGRRPSDPGTLLLGSDLIHSLVLTAEPS